MSSTPVSSAWSSRRPVAVCALALLTASCLLSGQSRVRGGQLYAAGNPTYDAYFREVHAIQKAAPQWPDARRAARKPLCEELKTPCDVPDATLAQLTHERMAEVAKASGPLSLELVGDEARMVAANGGKGVPADARPLFRAVEVTARGELDRGRRMRATSTKIDQLVLRGHDLEPRVTTDFTRQGVGKSAEVKDELRASFDVLAPHASTTHAMAQGAEDFVLDLKRAIVTAGGLPAAPGTPGSAGPGKGKGPGTPPSTKPPASTGSAAATPAPAATSDAPKPAPKKPPPAEEVFNP